MVKDIDAAIFDIDHTLTRHSTAMRCAVHNLWRGKVPFGFLCSILKPYLRYKKGEMDLQNCDDLMEGMIGFPREMLDEMGFVSFEKYSKRDIYESMVELINNYQREGVSVVLATSSPRFVVEPYYRFFRADDLISTELEYDGEQKTSGRFMGPVAFEEGKRSLLESYLNEKGLDPVKCAFYSDSVHDLPSLELCGHPVATNPDRDLRKIALDRGWEILDV